MHPEEYRRLAALEGSHWWYRALHDLVLDLIERHAHLLPPSPRILDAGCGTGLMARRLTTRGDVVAIDMSPHAAGYWKNGSGFAVCGRDRPPQPPNNGGSLGTQPAGSPRYWGARGAATQGNPTTDTEHHPQGGHPQFLRGSISALPFRDASFDLVVSLDVLYHRAVGDDAAAACELARVLRAGGLLVLNLPAYNLLRSAHDRAIHTARRYTRGRVTELLTGAGLTPLRVAHWNTLLFPLAAAARLAGRLRRVPEEKASDLHAVAPTVNEALCRLLRCELALHPRWNPPFGLSIVALARKAPAAP